MSKQVYNLLLLLLPQEKETFCKSSHDLYFLRELFIHLVYRITDSRIEDLFLT